MEKYLIGIDLGTTNCTVAYKVLEEDMGQIDQFSIPQISSIKTDDEHYSLPSFIYFPLTEEYQKLGQSVIVGLYAKERGSEIPTHLISSAKSWLSHAGIDRRGKILPINSDEVLEKMSPLEACAILLKHILDGWNRKMPSDVFQDQQIIITVPASFDPSARQLVQEAADLAGYPKVILLEEPQAAFYSWLNRHKESWRDSVNIGDHILVIDVGGGTTDFSLISISSEKGDMVLERVAVGSHLLLGGDNIDVALSYLAKSRLEEAGHYIDDWQQQSLIHACRKAKELFMSEKESPDSIDLTILGRGSRLIGGTLTTTITQKEVYALVLEGFIPMLKPQERSLIEKRGGLQQLGLPYAQDPRLSAQLARFLSMSSERNDEEMETFILPNLVLFNGGTMKAKALRDRLMDLLNDWALIMEKPPVKELQGSNYDYAVSQGAVYYGIARQGKAIRIKGGTSRSYFVGVEESAPAVPGRLASLKAVCIVPFGMEEGTEQDLNGQEFVLILGEQATFRFFSHSTPQFSDKSTPEFGQTVKNWQKELLELHPIETVLDKSDDDGKIVRVKLKSKVTELGVLELWCVAQDGRQWKLEFDIREDKAKLREKH